MLRSRRMQPELFEIARRALKDNLLPEDVLRAAKALYGQLLNLDKRVKKGPLADHLDWATEDIRTLIAHHEALATNKSTFSGQAKDEVVAGAISSD